MAINDISLTSGMRSNLTTLQSTAKLLDRTQNRLSTGKKVNSAIDNPTSFFAAQSLNSRASIIDGLKDAMGQAIQTVQAADKGITAITSLIEQAKGVAQAAAAAPASSGAKTVSLTIGASGIAVGSTVFFGIVTLTATDNGSPGSGEFYIGGSAEMDALALTNAINSNGTLTNAGYSASAEGLVVTISYAPGGTPANFTEGDITGTAITGGSVTEATVEPTTELSSLQTQYNGILDQIDMLAADSSYKGKNLLTGSTGTGLLTVKFEGTHSLDVVGFDATSGQGGTGGLKVTDAEWTTAGDAAAAISADLTKLDNALTTLRQNAAAFSANLSIITTRQDFSTNMVTTLTDGADKLTLADTNEEGANMLMLQTRQSLGTTALSLSAQAAQSVLRLFG